MTSIPPAKPSPSRPNPPGVAPRVGGGVRGYVGDIMRAVGSGYAAVTDATATQAERQAIHPFEGVTGLTRALRDATHHVRGLSRVTGLLHAGAGFGMLVLTNNVANNLRSPGESVIDVTHRAADLLDGRRSAPSWSLGWGVRATEDVEPERSSEDGDALADLGIG